MSLKPLFLYRIFSIMLAFFSLILVNANGYGGNINSLFTTKCVDLYLIFLSFYFLFNFCHNAVLQIIIQKKLFKT